MANGTDNTPAVSRINKGAVSSDGPAAHLCNYACHHQRTHRYCHLAGFLPGDDNVMADDASRLQELTDSAFLSHFEQQYPQPAPWILLPLPTEISSPLICALLSTSPPLPLPPNDAKPPTKSSACGPTSANNMATPAPLIASWLKTNSPTCSSSACATAIEGKRTNLFGLTQFATPSPPSARGSPTWTSRIRASPEKLASSIPYSMLLMDRSDSPATRAYPVNTTILRSLVHVLDVDHPTLGYLQQHTIHLTILAFFWILRPAEYLYSPDSAESRSQAFCLRDVTFTIRGKVYSAIDAPLNDENGELLSADQFAAAITTASLTFTDQKNAVKGESRNVLPTTHSYALAKH